MSPTLRGRLPWAAFAVSVAVVWAVMAWATTTLLRMEAEQARSRAQADLEDRVRLSLWRLDGLLPPRLSRELAQVRLAADGLEVDADTPGVLVRFVIDFDGTVRQLGGTEPARLTVLDLDGLADRLDDPGALPVVAMAAPAEDDQALGKGDPPQVIQSQRSSAEFSKRALTTQDNLANAYYSQVAEISQRNKGAGNVSPPAQRKLIEEAQGVLDGLRSEGGSRGNDGAAEGAGYDAELAGSPRAIWVDDALVVARTIRTANAVTVHGSVLDWRVWQGQLATEVEDLLPHVTLAPAPNPDDDAQPGRLLASLPVALDPGPVVAPERGFSPLMASLVVGWLFVLVATGAVGGLTAWSLRLSERRAAFVSAVTHELRTPLTTFRMYTEMLEDGMVDEAKRARYVSTLRREADRLGGLVENVLAYARIESHRAEITREHLRLRELVDRVRPRLTERAAGADLALRFDVPDDVGDLALHVDPTAAEQILFNLVDNAAKYAPSEDDPNLELRARSTRHCVELTLRDHGPGIPSEDVARIFAPFAKAKPHAAGTKPGVGLGLALCRGLARQMGGDLTYTPADPGSTFTLSLPRG